MTPQTTAQILRCLMLGSYETCVVAGEPKIRSSLPLVGPLPDSTRAQRDEIIDFLGDCCGGEWSLAIDSEFYDIKADAA